MNIGGRRRGGGCRVVERVEWKMDEEGEREREREREREGKRERERERERDDGGRERAKEEGIYVRGQGK